MPRSIWQTINTLIPYFLLFYLSMRSLESSFWLTLPLTLRSSLKCLKWRLYDETNHRIAGWDALRQYRQGAITA